MDTVSAWIENLKHRLAERGSAACSVRVTTRARETMIDHIGEDGTVHVRISAPPHDNLANKSLLDFLAESLDVPRSAVSLRKGHTSRNKLVHITLN